MPGAGRGDYELKVDARGDSVVLSTRHGTVLEKGSVRTP